MALYRIDLEEDDISAPRYFALAHRLPAYQGVLAARVEAERETEDEQQPYRPSTTPAPQASTGTREVHLTAFRAEFPGFISTGSSTPAEEA